MIRRLVNRIWYGGSPLYLPLLPLSALFRALVAVRRRAYGVGLLTRRRLPVPVVVVGNLSVGGSGKTPLVVWLARAAAGAGFSPGIIARGYGGSARDWPRDVAPGSDADEVGDEPVLLARRTACPVVAGPDRVAGGRRLLVEHGVDLVISDDGLQHYALARDLEVVVVDGRRGLGNGHCLPAGPLREGAGRLAEADMVVNNGGPAVAGYRMDLTMGDAIRLGDGARRSLSDLAGRRVHAVAGIGDPSRFFAALRERGLWTLDHAFGDHHRFCADDLAFGDGLPVVMTEKDAVKCARLGAGDWWYVPVTACPEASLERAIMERLAGWRAAAGRTAGSGSG